MLKFAFILAVLPALALGGRIEFHACPNGSPTPNWVAIEGCDMTSCSIVNFEEVALTAELDIAFTSHALEVELRAYILGIPIDSELPEHVQDGCNMIVAGCPVNAGETHPVATRFAIESPIAGITPTVELTMTNELGQEVLCVQTKIFVAPRAIDTVEAADTAGACF